MKQYLIPESGTFYKANMHMHTNVSDGNMSVEETKQAFLDKGYSIVAFTDHDVLVPHTELTDDKFLAITSYEVEINDKWPGGFEHERSYHLNLYAKEPNTSVSSVFSERYLFSERMKDLVSEECKKIDYRRHYSIDAVNDLIKKANADGFLVCYNHPVWSNQRYPDYAGLEGLWGVEVFNGGCNCGGFLENTHAFDDLLHLNKNVFPISSDDAHALSGCFRGWVQVKADKLEYKTVMDALERGDFYASTGPEIHELYIEDGIVHIECSDAREIFLHTERRETRAKRGTVESPVCEANFDLKKFIAVSGEQKAMRYRPWFRLEVIDHAGRNAVTRAFYVDELVNA